MTTTKTDERTNWEGIVEDINSAFVDFIDASMKAIEMQVKITDILVSVLKEHNLFSTILHKEGTNSYRIALKYEDRYRLANITKLRVNFNRFNMSLILCDSSEDLTFGTFRFRTVVGKMTRCTLTSMIHYPSTADALLVDELKEIFHETELRYDSDKCKDKEIEDDVDFNTMAMYDLCKKYTSDCILAGKISRCGYKDMSVTEFVNSVDFGELKKEPGIGVKTITLLREMYAYYGLDKLRVDSKD